jgi:hypothetical protein
VLVEWHRVERVSPKLGLRGDYTVWRLVLWTKTDRWRPYYVLDDSTALDSIDDVEIADVTGDGDRDVLASDVQGNHGSGPYRVVQAGPHPDTLLAGDWAESRWFVRRGILTIVEPRGGQSVCCPDWYAYVRYRWTGRTLVVAKTRLVRQHY